MKYVFNILIAFAVIWIVWSVIDHSPKKASVAIAEMSIAKDFDGARIAKTSKERFHKPTWVDFCNDEMFVSNTAPNDSAGYVCRSTLYGGFVDTLHIADLKSPKGMVEKDGYLYIADGNRIAKYDIDGDSLVSMIYVEGARDLADIEKDHFGRLFASDPKGAKVFCINDDTAHLFAADTLLNNVMGLSYYKGNIYAGVDNHIMRIDPKGKTMVFANVVYSVYGICADDGGNFITTDFAGNVYAVSSGRQQLIVKKRQGLNAAGIGYIPEQKILAVPTYAGNSVEIYEIGRYLQQREKETR